MFFSESPVPDPEVLTSFNLTTIFNMLFFWLSKVVLWTQTNGITLYGNTFSFFDLALGGYVLYVALSKLPIWEKMEDEFPEPYHSEYEDEWEDFT